jgi:hypothetical protein
MLDFDSVGGVAPQPEQYPDVPQFRTGDSDEPNELYPDGGRPSVCERVLNQAKPCDEGAPKRSPTSVHYLLNMATIPAKAWPTFVLSQVRSTGPETDLDVLFQTPLLRAALRNDSAMCQRLVDLGADQAFTSPCSKVRSFIFIFTMLVIVKQYPTWHSGWSTSAPIGLPPRRAVRSGGGSFKGMPLYVVIYMPYVHLSFSPHRIRHVSTAGGPRRRSGVHLAVQ